MHWVKRCNSEAVLVFTIPSDFLKKEALLAFIAVALYYFYLRVQFPIMLQAHQHLCTTNASKDASMLCHLKISNFLKKIIFWWTIAFLHEVDCLQSFSLNYSKKISVNHDKKCNIAIKNACITARHCNLLSQNRLSLKQRNVFDAC